MTNIKLIRVYERSNATFADVIYTSGRCITYTNTLPHTALVFLRAAKEEIEQFDALHNRKEIIYK